MIALTEKQREKIEKGNWINTSIIVEVQGNDKDYVRESLEGLVSRLKKEKGVEVYETKYDEIREFKEKLFALNVEIKLLAKDFGVLIRISLLYSPSVIEIYAPKEIKIPIGEAQNIMADISNIVTKLAHAIFIQEGKLKKLQGSSEEKSTQ